MPIDTNRNDLPIPKDEKIINSVSDFLSHLKTINEDIKGSNQTLFFRGRSRKSRSDTPSIYRRDEKTGEFIYLAHEKELFNEIISRNTNDFAHCKTTLDHLVMMRHYGLPSRLLDITENPLVALYFACQESSKEEDGFVSLYCINDHKIKNSESDTASIIANLAKVDNDFSLFCSRLERAIDKYTPEYMKHNHVLDIDVEMKDWSFNDYLNATDAILSGKTSFTIPEKFLKKTGTSRSLDHFRQMRDRLEKDFEQAYAHLYDYINSISCQFFIRPHIYHANLSFSRYIHLIKSEKPYFEPDRIKFQDLESVICIRTKLDNPRIIRQSGAFLLFGLEKNAQQKSKAECATIPDSFLYKNHTGWVIPHEQKKEIRDELESLSISESHLFPEIENVAKYLTKKIEKNML